MIKLTRLPLVLFCLLSIQSLHGSAVAAEPSRILLIGNSYTAGVRSMLQAYVKASPHSDTQLKFINPGGKNLVFHSQQQSTLNLIATGNWDIVVLQDQSQTPAVLTQRFMTGSAKLHDAIIKSGAKTAYFQTWGRRDGDKRNPQTLPTFAVMQDKLTAAYARAAKRDQAILVPVGEAWREVRKTSPQLTGALYQRDGSHPAKHGAYVAAVCFYAKLLGGDPSKVGYTGQIPADEAKQLQKAALTVLRREQ